MSENRAQWNALVPLDARPAEISLQWWSLLRFPQLRAQHHQGLVGNSSQPGREKSCIFKSEWQPTPVFLPGESHKQRRLVGYHPWGRKESDITEQLTEHNTTKQPSSERQQAESWLPGAGGAGEEGAIQSFSFARWKFLEICCTPMQIYSTLLNCTLKTG